MTAARRTRGERGSAAPLVLVVSLLLGVAALVSAVVGGAVTAQRRAASAADLAALAGAAALQDGRDACAAAREVAGANGAGLGSCGVAGEEVLVEATRPLRVPLLDEVTVRAQARAGPAAAAPGQALLAG